MLTAGASRALARGDAISPSLARGATCCRSGKRPPSRASRSPRVLVLGACASSTLAIGLALRWLALGRCDLALAGGFDTQFVRGVGVRALRATRRAASPPFGWAATGWRSARRGRRRTRALAHRQGTSLGYVAGFGASTDAVHLTAPTRRGEGLGGPLRWRSPTRSVGERNRRRQRSRHGHAVQRSCRGAGDRARSRRKAPDGRSSFQSADRPHARCRRSSRVARRARCAGQGPRPGGRRRG